MNIGRPAHAQLWRTAPEKTCRAQHHHAYRLSQVVFFGCDSPKLFYR